MVQATYTSKYFPKDDILSSLGGLDAKILSTFIQNDIVKEKYSIIEGIGSGFCWSAVLASKLNDRKEVIIKKISRARIPITEQYFPAWPDCVCTRCKPAYTNRPPLELILLQSKDNGMPEFIEYFEDESDYYIVVALHGVSKRQFQKVSWIGPKRFQRVYWFEYFN